MRRASFSAVYTIGSPRGFDTADLREAKMVVDELTVD